MTKAAAKIPSVHKPEDFKFPTEIIDHIYDLSGAADRFKGVMICVCNPLGYPAIFTKCDSPVTQLGMRKAIENWLMMEDNTDGAEKAEIS